MKTFKVFLLLIFISINLTAQNNPLSGKIVNSESKTPIEGVNIIIKGASLGTASDKSGHFFFPSLPDGNYEFLFSAVGYHAEELRLNHNRNTVIEIELKPSPIKLGEVKVVSTKQNLIAQNVPLPVEVVSKENIEAKNAQSLSEILNSEPGLFIAKDGVWGTHISIRGMSRQNIVALIDENRIETATNIAAGLSMIDLSDVERIEIIKGGVSSLYGSGATGGIINIVSKQAHYSENFYLSGNIGSGYNSVNKASASNVNLFTGGNRWYLKISGAVRKASDAKTPDGLLPNSRYKDNSVSFSGGINPYLNHEIKINYNRFYGEDIGIPGGKPFPAAAVSRYPQEKRELISAEYKIPGVSNTLRNFSIKYFHQFILRDVEIIPNVVAVTNTGADHKTDGLQLQSDWLITGKYRLIAGIDAWQRKYEGSRSIINKTLNRITVDSPVPNSKYTSFGIFIQNEIFAMQDNLIVNLGGRYDLINIKNDEALNPNYIISNGVRNDNPPRNMQSSFAAGNRDNSSWSTNLGLIYSLFPGFSTTLNLSQSFRSPTLEERFQYINLGGDVFLGNPDLKPEKGNSFDLGVRYLQSKVSFQANAFINYFTDLVADKVEIQDSLYLKSNIGKARLYGFELSSEFNFYADNVAYLSAAYVKGEDTGNNENLAEIPPFNGRLGVRIPLFSLINVDFSASWYANQENNAKGEVRTGGYTLYDLYLSTKKFDLNLASMQVFAGVENISDKAYRNHLSTYRGAIKLEPGRNLFIKAIFSF
jgi:hemoglobin/transferrin/lactoferrin receptor protein